LIVAAWTAMSIAVWRKLAHHRPGFLRLHRLLLVIAHPDDEAMFWAPTLLTMNSAAWSVLCFSTGDADGLGAVRKQELVTSCRAAGILDSNIIAVDDPRLRDGMNEHWPADAIAQYLLRHAADAEAIVTFDGKGISRHPNHIAVHEGVKLFLTNKRQQGEDCRGLALVTTNLLRKYIGPFDLPMTTLFTSSELIIVAPLGCFTAALRFMRFHQSQLVWFRHLFVFFSRYSYMNSYEEM